MQGKEMKYLNKDYLFNHPLDSFNSYILSLEGWRRGLKLYFSIEKKELEDSSSKDNNLIFSLSDHEKTFYFKGIYEKRILRNKSNFPKLKTYNFPMENRLHNESYSEYSVFFLNGDIISVIGRYKEKDIAETVEQINQKLNDAIIDYISHLSGWPYGLLLIKRKKEENELSICIDFSSDSLRGFLFPTMGDPINIPKKILDSYDFKYDSETTKKSSRLFFNLNETLSPIIKGASTKVKLPAFKHVEGERQIKILIKNENYSVMELKWIRNICRGFFSTGFMQITKDVHIEIVTSTTEDRLEKLKNSLLSRFNNSVEVEVSPWDKMIPIGFEFIGLKEMLIELLKEMEENHELNIKERDRLELQREQLKNSFSWKLTRPIRYITGLFKK